MNREALLSRMTEQKALWDVIVIGGGATGLGTALDAASRGYRTLLLEQGDFAKGTSSHSTKLIHGGLRYLRQGNIRLIRESLRERGLLLRNAPHLVHPLPFIVPASGRAEMWWLGLGLKIYDRLAGKSGIEPSRNLSRDEVLHRLPGLNPSGLRGGVLYSDAQFDDARLALALARTVDDLGGVALNYMRVVAFRKQGEKICGVDAVDAETGREFELNARVLINATGVFSDAIRRMDDPEAPGMLTPSRGSHIVLDRSFFPGDTALIVPKTDDGRVLFAIPWQGSVLIGTTDEPVNDSEEAPNASDEEIAYLLRHAARYLAKTPATSDILSVFAGLRPLVTVGRGRGTSKLPRDHVVLVSQSGLVTIAGGKWTTYRSMGEDAVNAGADVAGLASRPSRTDALRLHGWTDARAASGYGADAKAVDQLADENPAYRELLHPRLPYRVCEVIWSVRNEMARTVEDVLARRTRALFLDARASIEAAPCVAEWMGRELGRDEKWRAEQVAEFTRAAEKNLLWRG